MKYQVEMTDTFAGEANYCWVQRREVIAKSWRGAWRAARLSLGLTGKWKCVMECGDMRKYVPVPLAPVCVFIT